MRKRREKRRQKLSRQREREKDEGVGVDDSDAGFVMLSESLFFNSEAGKELRLTSPLASRSTAGLNAARVGVWLNAEERRNRVFGEQSAARKGEIFSADFIKCAGEGKPDFIKCGFGEAEEMAVELEVA